MPALPRTCRFLLFGCILASASPALAQSVSPSDATPAQKKDAKKSLDKGQKLQSQGKLQEAIAAFRESHDIVANPKTRLLIARALRDSGDLIAAEAEFKGALSDAEDGLGRDPKLQETVDAAKKDVKEMDGILGWLTVELIHAPEGTRVTLDGNDVETSKLAKMRVAPGPLEIIATAPDGTERSKKLTISAGQSATVKLPFARQSEPNTYFNVDGDTESEPEEEKPAENSTSSGSGKKTWAYVAGGVGVVGLGAFTAFGLMSNSKFNDLEDSCPQGHCPADRKGDIDDGKTYQLLANIGLGVGIAGVGTCAALLLFGGGSSAAEKKPESAELHVGIGSIELRGRFQ